MPLPHCSSSGLEDLMGSRSKDDAKNSEHDGASPGKIFPAGLPKDTTMMASSQMKENSTQCMTCRCVEGNKNFWTRASKNSESQSNSCPNCEILKSGPLFISSKGLGWTSWKKRWFVLSRKSLMFYRADPHALPQKGSEAPNPTLGGIELNNSGSVVVKQDKRLTVLFSDGRDGRAFTLKTETLDELNEWKTALEDALAQAPSVSHVMGQNGIFCNDVVDVVEASVEQGKDKFPTTSSIVGRPVLLALEDIDGSPSFLEKALSFIEEYGIKVEGILRESADVEVVVRRVQEYEQGKIEFSSDEDAHVIGDCIKHVLREMPSSLVPASCCSALVDAYRTDRACRGDYIRDAIYETFPEPNRRLLQRTLQMMLTVAAHKAENRMSLSALAACMAPLLLRPLLAGECELKNDFQIDGDGSFQIFQAAAAAANHAQSIVMILLEEYKKIFDYESFSSEPYTGSEDEDDTEDDESIDNDIPEEAGYHDAKNEIISHSVGDPDHSYSGTSCGNDSDVSSEDVSDLCTDVGRDSGSDGRSDVGSDGRSDVDSDAVGSNADNNGGRDMKRVTGSGIGHSLPSGVDVEVSSTHSISAKDIMVVEITMANSNQVFASLHESTDLKPSTSSYVQSLPAMRNKWGRTPARKNLSVESIEYTSDDESAVHDLENYKIDLQTKISNEIEGNAVLQASLDKRREALHEHRLILEKEVASLQLQLQKERELRLHLEAGLMDTQPDLFFTSACLDSKTRTTLEEIALSVRDINNLTQNIADITEQLQKDHSSMCESCGQPIYRNKQEDVNDIPYVQCDNLFKHDENAISSGDFDSSPVKDLTDSGHVNAMKKLACQSVSMPFSADVDLEKQAHDPSSSKMQLCIFEHQQCLPNQDNKASTIGNAKLVESNDVVKKSSSIAQDGASSSSALTKLTNRLNFLKERRVQLANELQNLDPSRATEFPSKINIG